MKHFLVKLNFWFSLFCYLEVLNKKIYEQKKKGENCNLFNTSWKINLIKSSKWNHILAKTYIMWFNFDRAYKDKREFGLNYK